MSRNGPFALLVHALTPDVSLRVSLEAFQFTCRGQFESLTPILCLTGSGRGQVISVVGDWVRPLGRYSRVAFLDPSTGPDPPLTRFHALETFLRYGFAKVLNRALFTRPTVIVTGIKSIAGAFEGRESHVLEQALALCGGSQGHLRAARRLTRRCS